MTLFLVAVCTASRANCIYHFFFYYIYNIERKNCETVVSNVKLKFFPIPFPLLLLLIFHIQTNKSDSSQRRGKRNGKQFNSVQTLQKGIELKTFDILIFKKQSHTLLCLPKLTGYGSELLIEGKSAT